MAVRDRLHRSELAVPGTNTRALEKAPALGADVVFLDLEDAVAPAEKDAARSRAADALRALDWGARTRAVRINGVDTPWAHREVIDRGLQVADATAFSLCMDNRMPILVFNLLTDGNIARAVAGEKIGTLVTT